MNFEPPILSVDVEDWCQSTWDHNLPVSSRAAKNTIRLIDHLQQINAKATMFVLGKFAERFPEIVRMIDSSGHEVASHGYGHIEIFHQSRKEFAEDVGRSKDLLEDIIGRSVRGYRAPDFSIANGTLWALETLAEIGFEYDSSIFPVRNSRYGIPNWPISLVSVRLDNGMNIIEFPIAVYRWRGHNFPIGGGGYFRLLPGLILLLLARSVLRDRPFVFYCHPYEFDPKEFKEMPFKIPLKTRLHQGLGRKRFAYRFDKLVTSFGSKSFMDITHSKSWPIFELDQFCGGHTGFGLSISSPGL